MEPPVPALADAADRAAKRLLAADRVAIASHTDADGLTSAAVAARALERAGIAHEVTFYDQLDDAAIDDLATTAADTLLLTDFGSGQADRLSDRDLDPVVADHHQPTDAADDLTHHLNPLSVGIDGSADLAGAGTTYVLARALAARGAGDGPDGCNRDLAALAVVGAIGDVQGRDGGLSGANARIAADGEAADVLASRPDLACFGRQTRPLPRLLSSADVRVPGVTDDAEAARRFLDDLPVPVTQNGDPRRWVDLDTDERRTIVSALLRRAVERGVPSAEVESLVGTSYTLSDERPGTELRDASEYATLLNATARYDRAEVGLRVCLGDRDEAYDAARDLLRTHRRNISAGIDLVRDEGVTGASNCQWFHANDAIRPTVVGIVAGMALGTDTVDARRPIVAFADDDGAVKVSARATRRLVRQGLDLAAVMREAASAVDGEGGGHDVAAGATIPTGSEDAFLDHADERIGAQIGADDG